MQSRKKRLNKKAKDFREQKDSASTKEQLLQVHGQATEYLDKLNKQKIQLVKSSKLLQRPGRKLRRACPRRK